MELEQVDAGALPAAKTEKSLMDVETAKAVAQIRGAMAVAKRFPRDEVQAINRIKQAAQRRRLASPAEYEYKRGGSWSVVLLFAQPRLFSSAGEICCPALPK